MSVQSLAHRSSIIASSPQQQRYGFATSSASTTTSSSSSAAAAAAAVRMIPTLDTILINKSKPPYSSLEFRNFLKKSHCYENYDFYTQLSEFALISDNYTKRLQWLHILKNFVEVCSEYEINLTGDLRNKLLCNFDIMCDYSNESNLLNLQIPSTQVLEEAKDETHLLLQDAYMQFLKSVANHDDNSVFVDKQNIYDKSNHQQQQQHSNHNDTSSNNNGSSADILISGNYCLTAPTPRRGSNIHSSNKTYMSNSTANSSIISLAAANAANGGINPTILTRNLININNQQQQQQQEEEEFAGRCSSPLSDSNSNNSTRSNSMDFEIPGLDSYLNTLGNHHNKNSSSTTITEKTESNPASVSNLHKGSILSNIAYNEQLQKQNLNSNINTPFDSNSLVPRSSPSHSHNHHNNSIAPNKKSSFATTRRKSFMLKDDVSHQGKSLAGHTAHNEHHSHHGKHKDSNWKKVGRKLKLF